MPNHHGIPAEDAARDEEVFAVQHVADRGGATFVARSFSGDKAQLVPIIEAGLAHRSFAFEVITGLLYLSPDSKDVHGQNDTVPGALYNLPHAQLCPGNDALQKLQQQFR